MKQLDIYRKELNAIDAALIDLLGKRFATIRAIGHYKKQAGIPMMQPARVEEVKERCAKMGMKYDLPADFVKNLFGMIIDEACRLEDLIIDKEI